MLARGGVNECLKVGSPEYYKDIDLFGPRDESEEIEDSSSKSKSNSKIDKKSEKEI